MDKPTSWGKVADWYNSLLEKDEDSYQKKLILPNLIRLLKIKRGETILDLACGQGFFAREFAKLGAKVIGSDISSELIEIAKQDKTVEYHVSGAHKLDYINDSSVDKATIILSLQNIRNALEVISEVNRVLKPKGRLFMVLNHPAFRIPKKSSWGYDEARKTQYRRLDGYLSESVERIQMHPGDKPWEKTLSFHRPLQFYFKALRKTGFCVSGLEEWVSHKTSEVGPKKETEDKARHEFPLFLYLEATKKC
jgi:ubiquinone/menaquinone biosynthesis C-methylase UbiE